MKRKNILIAVLLMMILASFLAACEQPQEVSEAQSDTESGTVTSSVESILETSSDSSSESSDESSEEEIALPSDDESREEESLDESSKEESLDESSEEESADESSEETSSEEPESFRTATVTYNVPSAGETYTRLPSLEQLTYLVSDADNERGLDTQKHDFGFGVATGGKAHATSVANQQRFDSYGTNALAWDNKTAESEKVLYLTFDCGYKYEDLIERILATLEEKDVPAAFFCTMQYLKTAPQDVVSMIEAGHIVGNHSVTHPSNSASLSREELAKELLGVENYLRERFGYSSKYFRFPGGVHSENAIDLVDSVGYRAVFWSLAHTDWDPQNQPGVEKSFETVTSRLHTGAVILLHSTSPDNADILADFIDYARAQGYTFKSLDDYAYWQE